MQARTPGVASKRIKKHRHILSPMVWPTWIGIGLGWLVARMPLAMLFPLGHALGALFFRFGGSRRRITLTNLRLCFPELDEEARTELARCVFMEVMLGVLELAMVWLNPRRDLSGRFDLVGVEHLKAAVAEGRGVVLLGGHFAVMDAINQALRDLGNIDVMYRANKNPAWEWLQVRGRRFYFDGVVERADMRATLRRLRAGRAIWYAADQDYGREHSVFAPFFGIQTASITATARLARFNDSPVLMMTQHRDYEQRRWRIEFTPIMADFPRDDELAAATYVNATLEAVLRERPDQYLWLHKRFKTRPEGEPSFYKKN